MISLTSSCANYEYDPYGNILSVDTYNNDNIGNINPIRYKDYYYDLQTGWYQLCSRFYDPEVGRFLNADDLSLLMNTDSSVVDKNLYAYCDGNPVMRKDNGGDCWNILVGAAIGAVVGAGLQFADNFISGEKLTKGLLTSAGTGALTGAISATGIGLVTSVACNAGVSALRNVADQVVKNKGFNHFSSSSLLFDTVGGALSGGKGMGKFVNIKTLNKNLTKKVFSGSLKKAKKGLKYYASQTKYAYRKYLFRPAKRSVIVGLFLSGGAHMYNQWR